MGILVPGALFPMCLLVCCFNVERGNTVLVSSSAKGGEKLVPTSNRRMKRGRRRQRGKRRRGHSIPLPVEQSHPGTRLEQDERVTVGRKKVEEVQKRKMKKGRWRPVLATPSLSSFVSSGAETARSSWTVGTGPGARVSFALAA